MNPLREIAEALGRALDPLAQGLSSPEAFETYLARLGLALGDGPASDDARAAVSVALPPNAVSGVVQALQDLIDATDDDARLAAVGALLQNLVPLIAGIVQLSAGALGQMPAGIRDEFVKRIGDAVIVDAIDSNPRLGAWLRLIGVVQTIVDPAIVLPQGGDGGPADRPFSNERDVVNWTFLPDAFTNLGATLGGVYGWGGTFEHERLIQNVSRLVRAHGLPGQRHLLSGDLRNAFFAPSYREPIGMLRAPLYSAYEEAVGALVEIALNLVPIPPAADNTKPPEGFAFVFEAEGQQAARIDLGGNLHLETVGRFESGIALEIRPTGVSVRASLFDGPTPIGSIDGSLLLVYEGQEETILFGEAGGTRLSLQRALAGVAVASKAGGLDVGAKVGFQGATLVLDRRSFDGFLQQVFPEQPIRGEFDLVLTTWFTTGKIDVEGGAELLIICAVNLALGPLTLTSVEVSLGFDFGKKQLTLGLGASISLKLGPLAVSVLGLGVKFLIDTAPAAGTESLLGKAGLEIGVKPPRGLGLSIETSALRLGGFLVIDPVRGRYAGGIELTIFKKLSLVAVGLLTTKRADGSPGFSLLIVVTTEFPVPIHLAYGFFLAGVGGVLGLSRGVDVDRMREGLKSGVLDRVLFPKGLGGNVDAIVNDLEQVFPEQPGDFLIGPTLTITWANPPLIKAKLGLVLSIGSSFQAVILGTVRLALPTEEEAIVDLKVAFLGSIDFKAGLLAFDASIYDSYIGRGDFRISFEGDIALRISWGEQKDFLISVGGFHPSYKAPAHLKLPPMKRITVSFLKDNPHISITAYFALTTNSVQFGAALDFYFDLKVLKVLGALGFDVLFQFNPFFFSARIFARLGVFVFGFEILGIELEFELQGTTPWQIRGRARIRILFFDVSADFEKRWGEEAPEPLPEVEVFPLLIEALEKPDAWLPAVGEGSSELARAKSLPSTQGAILVDAAGRIDVRQDVMPVERHLDRFGDSRPADVDQVRIASLRIGAASGHGPAEELFAPALFRDMSEAQKLASPSYERMPCGAASNAHTTLLGGGRRTRPIEYEQAVVPPSNVVLQPLTAPRTLVTPDKALFEKLVVGGAAARSSAGRSRQVEAQRGRLGGTLSDEVYAVVRADTLVAVRRELSLSEAVVVQRSEAKNNPDVELLVVADARAA